MAAMNEKNIHEMHKRRTAHSEHHRVLTLKAKAIMFDLFITPKFLWVYVARVGLFGSSKFWGHFLCFGPLRVTLWLTSWFLMESSFMLMEHPQKLLYGSRHIFFSEIPIFVCNPSGFSSIPKRTPKIRIHYTLGWFFTFPTIWPTLAVYCIMV